LLFLQLPHMEQVPRVLPEVQTVSQVDRTDWSESLKKKGEGNVYNAAWTDGSNTDSILPNLHCIVQYRVLYIL
jgi:hypothetical protein